MLFSTEHVWCIAVVDRCCLRPILPDAFQLFFKQRVIVDIPIGACSRSSPSRSWRDDILHAHHPRLVLENHACLLNRDAQLPVNGHVGKQLVAHTSRKQYNNTNVPIGRIANGNRDHGKWACLAQLFANKRDMSNTFWIMRIQPDDFTKQLATITHTKSINCVSCV